MSDTDTTEPTINADAPEGAAAVDGTPEAENATQNADPAEDGETRGRAARYRERAQAAEARITEFEQQTAAQAATIERLQRMHVEHAITATGVKPAAVFAVAELASLLDDTGLPDAEKITAAVATARDQLGLQPRPVAPPRQQGMRSGASAPQPKRSGWDGFVGALQRQDN